MMKNNPLICALDTQDITLAKSLCQTIRPFVGMVKLGLEFFTTHGSDGVKQIAEAGIPIFLDLKFHDIPNTVAKAVTAATQLPVEMITIHTSGGFAMMQAAQQAAQNEAAKLNKQTPLIVGVTILTSLDQDDLQSVGYAYPLTTQVQKMAELAKQAGLDGIVCSPHEIKLVKQVCGKMFKTIVPGIRLEDANTQDQKRTLTPNEALTEGADYLVIGRPITQSKNPADTAKKIYEELKGK